MQKWTDAYNDLKDIYIKEFLSRWDAGVKAASGINNYLTSMNLKPAKIIDMPAGIGRISIPLSKYGFEVMGIDSSEHFIKYANSIKEKDSCKCNFIVSDMFSSFDIINKFRPNVIINWWTSIGYMTEEDDLTLLKRLYDSVDPGTILLLETWHRHFILSNPIRRWWYPIEDMVVLVENSVNPLRREVTSVHTYYSGKIDEKLKFMSKFTSEIILYDAFELKTLIERAGWSILDTFNSIETQTNFNPKEDRIVFVARK
jgi:hypothetical protein